MTRLASSHVKLGHESALGMLRGQENLLLPVCALESGRRCLENAFGRRLCVAERREELHAERGLTRCKADCDGARFRGGGACRSPSASSKADMTSALACCSALAAKAGSAVGLRNRPPSGSALVELPVCRRGGATSSLETSWPRSELPSLLITDRGRPSKPDTSLNLYLIRTHVDPSQAESC